jgi:hypothetical protein
VLSALPAGIASPTARADEMSMALLGTGTPTPGIYRFSAFTLIEQKLLFHIGRGSTTRLFWIHHGHVLRRCRGLCGHVVQRGADPRMRMTYDDLARDRRGFGVLHDLEHRGGSRRVRHADHAAESELRDASYAKLYLA